MEISPNSFFRSDPVSMLACSTVEMVNDAFSKIVCNAALSLASKYMNDAKTLPSFIYTYA